MKQEHINEIIAVVVLALGMILLASLLSFVPEDLPWYTSAPNDPAHNMIRIVGAYLAGSLLFVFGNASYFLVVFLFFWSWNKFVSREIAFTVYKFFSFLVLFGVVAALLSMVGASEPVDRFARGGMVGIVIADFLIQYVGRFGAYITLLTLGTLALILTGEFLVTPFLAQAYEVVRDHLNAKLSQLKETKATGAKPKPKINIGGLKLKNAKLDAKPQTEKAPKTAPAAVQTPEAKAVKPTPPEIRIAQSKPEEPVEKKDYEPILEGEYNFPSLDLLNEPPQISTDKIQNDLMDGAKMLEETLASFGVEARVADIERGPAITRYELEPGVGVKVQKFTTLTDDIALAMKVAAVRIVAPIPGKNRVGVEVPNSSSAAVYLKEVLGHPKFRNAKSKLALALGKDIAGEPMIADLAEMPHLLIAGTTGSGKTVCVNDIIMSMLYNASPDEVKFVMVDPKMVELAQYNDLPHMLSPTITDCKKASAGLNWVVAEMESRYQKLSKVGVRNIKAYNAKEDLHMPYIVVIIDELADLMQVSAKQVESSITRLAQLSRAVGIHLILATQRPSVDVITGVIKANFPARISFKVSSKVDSRTVLDMNGAESLLGKGDMLFIQPGDAKPTRGQASFVDDAEIHKVIDFIKDQQKPVYDETITKQQVGGGPGGSDQHDELFDEAVRLVIETNQASVSILQRRMRLGYTRAARLIDMMEQHGIVGPFVGSKPRDILVDREQWMLDNMRDAEELAQQGTRPAPVRNTDENLDEDEEDDDTYAENEEEYENEEEETLEKDASS